MAEILLILSRISSLVASVSTLAGELRQRRQNCPPSWEQKS